MKQSVNEEHSHYLTGQKQHLVDHLAKNVGRRTHTSLYTGIQFHFLVYCYFFYTQKSWNKAATTTYTMKSSMSMILARFSEKLASCKTLSIFLLMLKSAGTSCWDERHNFKIQTGWYVILKERKKKKRELQFQKRGEKKKRETLTAHEGTPWLTTLCTEQWIL